jgi:predicted SnoaL-like aldol condensation-catalyzing enzyme
MARSREVATIRVVPSSAISKKKEMMKPELENKLEANKAVVRRYMDEVLNGRDVDALDHLAAEDYLDHPAFSGQGPGRQGMKYRISYLLAALDPHWTPHDLIAEGDLVVTRWTLAGTQRGEFLGIQPTGKEFTLKVIEIYRVKNGMMTEHWNVVDMFGLHQQLGVIPGS